MRLFDDDNVWEKVTVGNEQAFRIFQRHYTYRRWRHRGEKNGKRFIGPGEHIMLLSKCKKALFVWRKEKYRKDGQTGVECSVFRNESSELLSSELIVAAEKIALLKWPEARLFTFVNPKKINSANPGYCFKVAGWQVCGETKAKKLIILEKVFNGRSPVTNVPQVLWPCRSAQKAPGGLF